MKKLLTWISRHMVLLIVLVFVFAGFLYREQIFGIQPSASGIEEQSEVAELAVVDPEVMTVSAVPMKVLESNHTPAQQTVGTDELSAEKMDAEQSDQEGAGEERAQVVETGLQDQSDVFVPPVSGDSMGDSGVNQESGRALTPVELEAQSMVFRPLTTESDSAAGTHNGAEVDRELESAREAYWNGNEDLAIERYLELIHHYPERIDGYGEIGNIYLKQGDAEAAFSAYRSAVELLNQNGSNEEALQLVEKVRGVDGKLGDRLQQYIGAVQ